MNKSKIITFKNMESLLKKLIESNNLIIDIQTSNFATRIGIDSDLTIWGICIRYSNLFCSFFRIVPTFGLSNILWFPGP